MLFFHVIPLHFLFPCAFPVLLSTLKVYHLPLSTFKGKRVGVLRSIQLSYEYLFLYCLLIIHCYLHKIKKGYLLSLKKDDEVAKLGYSI